MTPSYANAAAVSMLTILNALQLILYVALLALLGQGVLYLLAGHKRDSNLFYGVLKIVGKPFTSVVRKITPAKVADEHVPVVTFFLLLIIYVVVTFEKINFCINSQMAGCR